MKRLLVVLLVLTVLWSGYWFIASRGVQAGYAAWFEARRAEGWQAEYRDLSIKGYPNRVDATLDAPVLADPDTGLAWQAPFFQVFALSYKPNHLIAVWPETQKFSTPLNRYDVASTDMRASLVMGAETSLPLERANLVAGAMTITPETGGATALSGLQLALTRQPGALSQYRIALNSDGFSPPPPQGLALQTGDALPRQLDALRADMTVDFDRPWDITALNASRPQPTRIRLKLAEARWGRLNLMLAGALDIDPIGQASGQITVKAENWRDILALATAANWLPRGVADTLEDGLALIAGLSGNPDSLDLPLDFSRGRISLGPIPLGPAPVFRIR